MKAEIKLLADKCEDLEGRARRNNIRLVGVPEGAEGVRPTEFSAKLLMDSLGLADSPLLDRAHRTLRPKPGDGKPPQPFVIRVHFFHVRNDILRWAGEASMDAPLLFQGKRVSFSRLYFIGCKETCCIHGRQTSVTFVSRSEVWSEVSRDFEDHSSWWRYAHL